MNNQTEKELNKVIATFIFQVMQVLAKHKLDTTDLPQHYQPLVTELDNFNKASVKRNQNN